MRNLLFLIITILIFEGCAQTNISYNKVRESQTVKTFDSLIENNITINEEFIITLGDKYKEVILENNEKLFAMKINLSKVNTACSINIKSYTPKGFFAPKLIFLDKDYTPIKTINAKKLRFDRGQFKGTIFLNEDIKDIKYLILTQDIEEINKKYETSHVSTSTISTGYFYYTYASGDTKSTLKNTYGGNIKLILKAYSPCILGEDDKSK
jgi:hypothetical protein